jgi:hypothetical protein
VLRHRKNSRPRLPTALQKGPQIPIPGGKGTAETLPGCLRFGRQALPILTTTLPGAESYPLLGRTTMAEKIKKLNIERDYKKYLYFIDGEGNVCQKPKSGEGESTVLVPNAVKREGQYLYFIDKDGDVSRSERGTRKKQKEAA